MLEAGKGGGVFSVQVPAAFAVEVAECAGTGNGAADKKWLPWDQLWEGVCSNTTHHVLHLPRPHLPPPPLPPPPCFCSDGAFCEPKIMT